MKQTVILFTGNRLLIAGSGIEDVIFQFGVCDSASLLGVSAGSHYNHGWAVRNAFSEALEQLLFKRLAYEEDPTILNRFHDLSNINKENLECLFDNESIAFTQCISNIH